MKEKQIIKMLRSTRPYNYRAAPEAIAYHKAAYTQWRYMVTRIADYLEGNDPLFNRLTFNQKIGVSGDFRRDLNATP